MAEPAETIDGVLYEEFGGELRRFVIKVPELAAIQAETDVGPPVIIGELARTVEVWRHAKEQGLTALQAMALGLGAWRIEYVTRPIFHGLVAGGAAPNEAGRLVRKWIDERGFAGLLENVELAFRIMTGATNGPKDDTVGELDGAPATTTAAAPPSRTARSASRSSTSAPARSAGAPPTSRKPRSGRSSRPSKAGARPTRRPTRTAS